MNDGERNSMRKNTAAGIGIGLVAGLTMGLIGTSAIADSAVMAAVPHQTLAMAGVPDGIAAAEAEAERKAKAEAARKAKAEAERKAREEAQRLAAEEEAAQAAQSSASSSSSGSSAYGGSYYNAAYEGTRQCIVSKESGGNYSIVSSNGLWHGAYQFTQGTSDAAARQMGRGDLVGTPASQWAPADQDQAFWTIWNNGAGRGNWPTAAGC